MPIHPLTPNVYINEVDAFPNSVVAVATAVPVFIGYTPRADHEGKSYLNQTVEINSLQDYLTFFGVMNTDPSAGPAPGTAQSVPIYHAVRSQGGGEVTIGGTPLDVRPDPGSIYYLYNSIKLFYENGGGTAFVVSVGLIGDPTGQPLPAGSALVNPNVRLEELDAGLAVAGQEPQITMIVIPDALLLQEDSYGTLMEDMLQQCGDTQSRVALLDVYGGEDPDLEKDQTEVIEHFRTNVGMNNLQYGVAYFPFLRTTVVQDTDIDHRNLGGGEELAAILPNADAEPLRTILSQIQNPPTVNPPSAGQLESVLRNASPEYGQLRDRVLSKINTLPPSGAMAGVYTATDYLRGVWNAPANVSLTAVTDTTLKITDQSQETLNEDAATGKSINAIRQLPGRGVLVWGARTLDGNSRDWRYVSVRRTVIMIEQSIRPALRAYVFAPNAANTWALVRSLLTSFLTGVWHQGGLAGSTAAEAFDVAVGPGITMTPDDLLNGILRVEVGVAVNHPSEFIVITVSQKLQGA